MAEVVRMPKMSDTMTEGVIVDWHKKVGDKVKPGDVIADIETDKAVMEFESFQEGTLLYMGAEKGATVKVNDIIAVLGKEGEDYKSLLTQNGSAEKQQAEQKQQPEEEKKQPAEEENPESEQKPQSEKTEAPRKTEQAEVKKPQAETPKPVAEDGRIKASPLAKKLPVTAVFPFHS